MAAALVEQYTTAGTVVYDPFFGCGTFAFESWRAGREVIAHDVSPYARLLTRGKLFPYASLGDALGDLFQMAAKVNRPPQCLTFAQNERGGPSFFLLETLPQSFPLEPMSCKRKQRGFLTRLPGGGTFHH